MGEVVRLRPRSTRDDVIDILRMLLTRKKELGASEVSLLPIDVCEVASLLGLTIESVYDVSHLRAEHPWARIDAEVPGGLHRDEKKIVVVTGSSSVSRQRYTIAHEIGHWLFHAGPVQFRERVPRKARPSGLGLAKSLKQNKWEEREAEEFAAELLMPSELAREASIKRFGGAIEICLANQDIAHHLSAGVRQKITLQMLANMPQLDRASLFARAKVLKGCTLLRCASFSASRSKLWPVGYWSWSSCHNRVARLAGEIHTEIG